MDLETKWKQLQKVQQDLEETVRQVNEELKINRLIRLQWYQKRNLSVFPSDPDRSYFPSSNSKKK